VIAGTSSSQVALSVPTEVAERERLAPRLELVEDPSSGLTMLHCGDFC